MLYNIRKALLAAVLAIGSTAPAAAATVTDPGFYTDLAPDTTHILAGFTLAGPVSGPATLDFRMGQWSGFPATLELTFTFNGTALATILSTEAYYGTPEYGSRDVSALITSGANTLSVIATALSGGPTTYSVGEVQLTYATTAPVPLPATLPLLLAGFAGLGILARRRKPA